MFEPVSKFSLGQPIEKTWDYNGQTLGRVRAKYWIGEVKHWGYVVQQANGEDYIEREDCLRAVRFNKVALNVVRAA